MMFGERRPGRAVPPRETSSLSQVLAWRAATCGQDVAMTSLSHDLGLARQVTYAQLQGLAEAAAARLAAEVSPGGRVLLFTPDPIDYMAGLFGCLSAGLVPVSGVPPQAPRARGPRHALRLQRLAGVIESGRVQALFGPDDLLDQARGALAASEPLRWVTSADRASGDPLAGRGDVAVGSETADLALLQYTSGSTSAPRGIAVSHANLLANLETQAQALGVGPGDVGVSWLPLFHDLGLIGATLLPIFAGFPVSVFPAAGFLERPRRWLEAMSELGGTISWAPNFAYRLCAGIEDRSGLDLSRWRVAMNAAEPVSADTIRSFSLAYEPSGFSAGAMLPSYGLAEATLGVSAPRPGDPPRSLHLDRAAFGAGVASPATIGEGGNGLELVSCGAAAPGVSIRIVDPATRRPRGPRMIGEIWVGGAGVASGYDGLAEDSAAVFGRRIPGEDGVWLATGDLGFLDADELFIAGRLKDVIILRGANHHPQDIEAAAARAHKAIRPTSVCAFSIPGDDGEEVVVIAELARGWAGAAPQVAREIRRSVHEALGLEVAIIGIAPLGGVPTTPSGKLQRGLCRAQYLEQALGLRLESRLTPGDPDLIADDLPFEQWIVRRLAQLAGGVDVGARTHLADLGLTSLQIAGLAAEIEATFARRLALAELYEVRYLGELLTLFEAA